MARWIGVDGNKGFPSVCVFPPAPTPFEHSKWASAARCSPKVPLAKLMI